MKSNCLSIWAFGTHLTGSYKRIQSFYCVNEIIIFKWQKCETEVLFTFAFKMLQMNATHETKQGY